MKKLSSVVLVLLLSPFAWVLGLLGGERMLRQIGWVLGGEGAGWKGARWLP